ncbi:Protein AF-9 -like protein [Babesia sp. Xinjiang]|uniref:Protein AF-9 -like protein n=1 Tax=Babesia sp. Xinjiang TaxID=462227 RepID=UPI000A2516C4|nr:Protein AF-9 -like protein [Babesia sp. Xinjiang]ORM39917.1 Protein AF-9 -like protein [Babesia sp. Xinjiang]
MKRVNVKVGKQIAVGTYAFPLSPLEKKRYGSMTHRWTCLLRSPTNENMTHYIKKVQFDLDPSFINPRRGNSYQMPFNNDAVLTTMPYEVTEVGWGEFYIGVKIYFVDESIEPVQLQHLLVLNPSDSSVSNPTTATNETFDEIIFNEPSSWFYKQLLCSATDILPPHKYQEYFWDHTIRDKETTCRYICCQSYFQNETYRLLAEASELSRQIQYLQEKASGAKNPLTTPENTANKMPSATPKIACATPTNQAADAPIKTEAADAVPADQAVSPTTFGQDVKAVSVSPVATTDSSTAPAQAEDKEFVDCVETS